MTSCYDFERSDPDYLYRDVLFDFTTSSWTMCSWINSEDTSHSFQGIVSQTDNSAPLFAVHGTKIGFWGDSDLSSTWLDGAVLSASTWYFVAITFDGGSGAGTGRLYSGSTLANFSQDNSDTWNNTKSTDGDIGVGFYRPSGPFSFDGKMSHTQVFSRALSIGELKEIMMEPSALVDGLVFHLPLDGNDEGTDISGNGNDFTTSGSPTASKDGPPVFF